MTSSEVWDQDTAGRYDADSSEMFSADVLDPVVDFWLHLPATVQPWSSR